MKKLLQKVSGRGAFNHTIAGLADILGFGKKKEVSGKVISSGSEANQPIGILCESTEKDFSPFTTHFSQNNPSPENHTFAQAQVDFLPSVLKLLHAHRVSPKLLRNRRLNLFAIRTHFTSSVRNFAPTRGEGRIFMVPSLFKGRLGWVFGRRKAATLRSASSVCNFAPTRGEGSSIYLSSEASEKVFSPFTKPSRGRNGLSQDKALQTRLVRGAVDSSQKAAFTLAEVLITLGIIGVVAAITMPSLIQNHRKHEIETRLKKVYSTMNQAMELSIANDTWEPAPNPRNAEIVTEWLPKVLVPYLDGVVYPARGINYPVSSWNNSYKMKLKDGSILFFRQGGQLFVGYDINGTKGPNKDGVDLFVFFLSDKNSNKLGYFYPSGYHYFSVDDEDYEEGDVSYVYGDREKMKKYCGRERSTNCALLIMTDGWRIADDYPVKL